MHIDLEQAEFLGKLAGFEFYPHDALTVSPRVAARLVGRSPQALRQAISDGVLPAQGEVHQHIRLVDLEEWSETIIEPTAWRRFYRKGKGL